MGPARGTALDEGNDVMADARVPPGQELIRLVPALRNVSGQPIEITKLRAVAGSGIPGVAQIVQVSALPEDSGFSARRYVTYPPVRREGGECVRAGVRPGRGLTLEPNEGWSVLVWMRALEPGTATVAGFRVTYEKDGAPYEQEIQIDPENRLVVAGDAPAVTPNRDERACAHRTRVLPGAVTF